MRLWLKLVLGIAVTVILLVAGAAIYVSRLDPTAHDAMIRNAVRDATGRELESDGEVRLRLLPVPSMEAAGVRFSNAPWASQPEMARIKLVRFRIAWLPLLQGRIVMTEFQLIEPEIFLETDAKGRSNWEFKPAAEGTGVTSKEQTPKGLGLSFDSVLIEKAKVTYRNHQTQETVDIVVDELVGESRTPVSPVDIRLRATYQNLPIELDGRWGDRWAFTSNKRLTPDLEGKLGDAEFTVKGVIERPQQGKGVKLDIGFQAKSTKRLTDLVGLNLDDMGPIDFEATLLEKGGRFDLESLALSGHGYGADLDARGSIADLAGEPKPDLKIKLSAESTTRLSELAGIELGEIGPLKVEGHLRERKGEIDIEEIELSARPLHAELDLKGSIASVMTAPKPDVDFTLSAKTLRQLYTPLPEVGPVKISAKAKPRGDVVEVRTFKATAGENDLKGSMTVDVGSKPPSAKAKLRAGTLNLDQLTPPPADSGAEAKSAPADDGRIFPDEPLPFAELAKVDADIDLTVDNLVGRRLTLNDVKVRLKLQNRNLSVTPAFRIAGGSVSGKMNVDAGRQPAKIALKLDGKEVELGAISEAVRGEKVVDGGPTDIAIDVNSNGDSVRTLMAGLRGDVNVSIGEGQLDNDRLDRIGGDIFMGLMSSVVPTGEKQTNTIMRCGVARFRVRDGFATADQTLVIESEKVLLKGGGTVDLASEQLDLGANIVPREGVRIVAGTLSSLVRVQGTLVEPRLATDLEGVVTASAKVGAALATMGVSLVAERLDGELTDASKPCETALARRFEPRERGSKGALPVASPAGKQGEDDTVVVDKESEEPSQKAKDEAANPLEAIGNGIKSLFK